MAKNKITTTFLKNRFKFIREIQTGRDYVREGITGKVIVKPWVVAVLYLGYGYPGHQTNVVTGQTLNLLYRNLKKVRLCYCQICREEIVRARIKGEEIMFMEKWQKGLPNG